MNISSIKDIENNKKNLKIIKGFIIYKIILKYILEDLLNYKEIQKLNCLPKDDNYIQQKNEIFKKILENPKTKDFFEQIIALDEKNFLVMLQCWLNFSFIDTELMNEINKQKDSDKKKVSLFKNNNLYFIYYQSPKNLFTINFQSDNGFTLEVPNFNKKS